ncbi:hypothetical protein [Halofilum ochraceum]|uniref:hypothetical protein n=1 Tax=Halofilum ochraceum TaxID=1611323 RepID=UPI0008D9E5F1|nr:hypothetical protein [Halofilum ochraceum]
MGGGGGSSYEETPEQRELAKIGVERMRHYEDVIKPVENEFINLADSMGEGEAEMAAGMATADTAAQMQGQADQVEAAQAQSGAKPGSGRFAAGVSGAQDAGARAGALSEVSAREGSEDRSLSAMNDVVNIGLGKAGEGQQGLSQVAGRAAAENIADTRAEYQESANMGNALASAGGLAYSQMDFGGGTPSKTRTTGYKAPDDGYRGV